MRAESSRARMGCETDGCVMRASRFGEVVSLDRSRERRYDADGYFKAVLSARSNGVCSPAGGSG